MGTKLFRCVNVNLSQGIASITLLQAARDAILALGSTIPKPEFINLSAGFEYFTKKGVALPEESIEYVAIRTEVAYVTHNIVYRVLKNECDCALFGAVRCARTLDCFMFSPSSLKC